MRPWRASLLMGAALAAAGCHQAPSRDWSGYAEGETLYIAAPVAGRVAQLTAQVGDTVTAQQALFTLEGSLERAADAEAQARLDSAQAQARNTEQGRRAEELAITEAQLRQARTQVDLAQSGLARQEQLLKQGFVARAVVDDAQLTLRQTQSRVQELEAALKAARLPARDDERRAARALASAAQNLQQQSAWRLAQTRQSAPQAGRVQDVFFRSGEWVGAGQPVLSLLPPSAIKVRFFVPEREVGRLHAQQAVQLACDGCGAPIAAHITAVSNQAEFTPPMIYSNAQRATLVFMVEARPDKPQDATRLHPGQPVDVRPLAQP